MKFFFTFLLPTVLLLMSTTSLRSQSPGGVSSGLSLWLRADNGPNVSTDNNAIGSWVDHSGQGMNGTGVNGPLYRSGSSTAAVNFNPVVSFNGTSQYFNLPGGFNDFTAGTSFFAVINPNTGPAPAWGRVFHLSSGANSNALTFNRENTGSNLGMVAFASNLSTIGSLYTTSGPLSLSNGFNIYQGTIAGGISQQNGRSASIFVNGSLSVSNSSMAVPTTVTRTVNRVGYGNGSEYFNGYLPELILYNQTLTTLETQKIQTYLAVKYGRTLGSPSSPADYVNVAGSKIWLGSVNYQFNVMGIGRDDGSSLHQRISASQDVTKDIITVSTDNSFTGDNIAHTALANDQSFLLFGNNGSLSTALQHINVPVSFCGNTLQRMWRVQRTNNVGPVNMQVNIGNTFGNSLSAGQILLFIDEDGDGNFATGIQRTEYASGYSGGVATFAGISFDTDNNGVDVFTLAVQSFTPMPVPLATTLSTTNACYVNGYLNYLYPDKVTQSLIAFKPDGNSFNPTLIQVANSSSLTAPGVMNTGNYYEQLTDGNTIRLANRFSTVVAPGTYSVNGGIIIRIYYTDADTMSMLSDPFAGGAQVGDQGWYKSNRSSANDVVSDMQGANLINANKIVPAGYGSEKGVRYVEFKVTDFSTFGYYAKTTLYALPIKLKYFKSKSEDCGIFLNWEAASEDNANRYVLEHSTDGMHFNRVGEIKVHGADKAYQFKHIPSDDHVFYRLKMVDQDESFVYSSVISEKFNCPGNDRLKVAPSPAHDKIFLVGRQTTVKQTVLLDANGKIIQRLDYQLNKIIDISKLSRGIYLLQVIQTNKQTQTLRFVKF